MSPKEIAELYRIALLQTEGDEPRARRLVEANLAGRMKMLPRRKHDRIRNLGPGVHRDRHGDVADLF